MTQRAFLASTYVVADGKTKTFNFSFAGVNTDRDSGATPYLHPEDVKVQELYRDAAGTPSMIQRAGELVSANAIRILGGPVAAGREIRIYRETEIRFPLVDYRDGQSVSEHDLDLANRQAVFLAQELSDATASAIMLDDGFNYNFMGRKAVNVAPGTAPMDAVNVSQLSRAIRGAQSEGPLEELPPASSRAGLMLSFDANGQPRLVVPQSGSVGEFAINLLNGNDPLKGSAMVGHAGGTVRSRLFSDNNPIDYGASGDGRTNDTAAFHLLEATAHNITIDLRGRTYAVDALPVRNKYINGKFKANGAEWSQGVPAGPSPASLHDYNYNSAMLWDIAAINGSTTNRGAQSFTIDERTRSLYVLEGGIVSRFSTDGTRDVKPLDASLVSPVIGHQGLGTEYLPVGIRLWSTSSVGGRFACRFQYAAGVAITASEVFELFKVGSFANSTSCTPSVSSCGNYLVASGTRFGTQTHVMRVFRMDVLRAGGPGDYTDKYLYEFETNGVYRAGNPVQGTACDGQNVFVVAGGTGFEPTTYKHLYVYSLSGELVSKEGNFRVGRALAQSDGNGTRYEPEGLCIMHNGSGYTLCAGFLSGQPGARRFRIYGMGMNRQVRAGTFAMLGNASGQLSSATTVDRYYASLRAESDLSEGSGTNWYSNRDSGAGGISDFTNSKTRRNTSLEGTTTLSADAGVTPLSLEMGGSGQIIEFKRGPLKLGGINVSTLNMTLFSEQGMDLMFGTSSTPGVGNVAWRISNDLQEFLPQTNGVQNIGRATAKIDQLFAKNGVINTSDARKKTTVRSLSPALVSIGVALAKEIGHFQWLDDLATKGNDARAHFGMTVQRAAEIFAEHGEDGYAYGALCYDKWDRHEETMAEAVLDDDGNVVTPAVVNVVEAGEVYSFRISELHWLIIGALAADQDRRLSALEAALNKEE